MVEQRSLPHALARISERPDILDYHMQVISSESPVCRQLARPLFDAGLYAAAVTQRGTYASNLHVPKMYRFMLLLRGSMMVRFGDQEYRLSPGHLACCPPGTPFKRWAEGSTWWLYFDFGDHEFWRPLKEHGPYIREHESPDLVFVLLQHLLDLHWTFGGSQFPVTPERPGKLADLDECTPRAVEYASTLLGILRQECAALSLSSDGRIRRLRALVQEIRLAPHQQWDVDSMGQRIHVSRSTLRRLTMSEYDLSPTQLVIQARLDEAVRQLQRSGNSIAAIANHVGYESVYSFTRLFTKHMGMAPGRYREKVLKKKLPEKGRS